MREKNASVKHGFRLNIIDIVIIIAVIGILVGGLSKFRMAERLNIAASDTPITFSVIIGGIRQGSVDSIQVDQGLFDTETGNKLGVITQVSVTPTMDKVESDTGELIPAPLPGRVDVTITARGTGRVTEEGAFLNGSRHVAPGGKLLMATDNYKGEATVLFAGEAAG
jgi:hypothetical protein